MLPVKTFVPVQASASMGQVPADPLTFQVVPSAYLRTCPLSRPARMTSPVPTREWTGHDPAGWMSVQLEPSYAYTCPASVPAYRVESSQHRALTGEPPASSSVETTSPGPLYRYTWPALVPANILVPDQTRVVTSTPPRYAPSDQVPPVSS